MSSLQNAAGTSTELDQVLQRLPGESDLAWGMFLSYLRMPKPRTLVALSAMVKKERSQLTNWAADFDWFERVAAIDALPAKAAIAEEVDLAKRSARVVGKLLTVLERETKRTLAAQDVGDPLGPSALAHLADTVIKLQRLVTGESTENHSHRVRVDLTSVSSEALAELKRATRREGT